MKLEIVRFESYQHVLYVDRLTAILHAAYAPLAAKGMRYLASHQPPERTLRRLLEGESYLAFLGFELVGTVTIYPPKTSGISQYYQREGVYSFGQFAIDPKFQKLKLGSQLMDFVEARAFKLGASELALDTSVHADHLISMYTNRGYDIVEEVQWEETNYRSHIMTKRMSSPARWQESPVQLQSAF